MAKNLFIFVACVASVLCGCTVGYPVAGRSCDPETKEPGPWLPVDGRITGSKVVVDGVRCTPVAYKNGHIFCETKGGGSVIEVAYSSMRMSDTSKIFWTSNLNKK
jgi:hypothetical protein